MTKSLTHATEKDHGRRPRPGVMTRVARRALLSRLEGIEDAILVLEDADGSHRFGPRESDLEARIDVHDPRFYAAVARRGSVGAAEAYMDGHWSSEDLPAVIRVLARNAGLSQVDRGITRLIQPGLKLLHTLRRNHRRGARRNIAAHYDLGNDFFSLFLDPSLTYSSAVFERGDMSLEEAQAAKYERLCRKLELRPGDRVLEIGGGWGGFALHAASRHGCHVTSATISREQYELSRKRVAQAGLQDRVDIVFRDYRDLEGTFDKLVSIEMIEAVGTRHLPDFFRVCSERLRPDGLMALQAILVPDQDWRSSTRNVDFVKRYIFPGGQLVSLGAMSRCIAEKTDLRIIHLEDITSHYAETLLRWRRALHERLDDVRALGLDDVFLRMWDFYFCYCSGGFTERAILGNQIVFSKARARREPVLGALA
jgi:cyclopropane-fatty-acyl-phospholipid synthase